MLTRHFRIARYFVRIAAIEDRIQLLISKYKIDERDMKRLLNLDPTGGSYLEWLAQRWDRGELTGYNREQNYKIRELLTAFSKIKKSPRLLQGNSPDINKYTVEKLTNLIGQVVESGDLMSNRERNKGFKLQGSRLVYDDGDFKIIQIGGEGMDLDKASHAACLYAYGTKWCTSSANTAKNYLEKDSLYVIFRNGVKVAQYSPRHSGDIHDIQQRISRNPTRFIGGRNASGLYFLIETIYNSRMKLVVQIQLLPDSDTAVKLRSSVERFNAACNWAAGEAFGRHLSNRIELQRLIYGEIREKFSLSAQMTCLCIRRVCEAYKRDKSIQPTFRPLAAMPYDQRTMSFKGIDRVSLLTLEGRVVIPFVVGSYGRDRLAIPKGQADLALREDGKWFLIVTVDVPEATPIPVTDFVGVDLGIAKIATDSDPGSEPHSGKPVEAVRRKHNLQRKRLQRKNTKGAKKKLKRISGKEARFRKHVNHVVSKQIVSTAKGTGRGIAVEDLSGIRDRLPAWGREAKNRLSGWSFGQLVAFLSYKAALAGVIIVKVDPRNTSRTCSACGHCSKDNRKSQEKFLCVSCGMGMNADKNAALNIRARAVSKHALELVSLGNEA